MVISCIGSVWFISLISLTEIQWLMYASVSQTIIGLDNGMSSVRCRPIIKTNDAWWRHKWKHFPRYPSFVWEIHRSTVNSLHKGRRALMFSLICAWIKDWVNNREAGDSRHHHAHYDVTVIVLINHFRVKQFSEIKIHQFRKTKWMRNCCLRNSVNFESTIPC